MLLVSWNVNGIRACYKNGLLDFLKKYKPDIIGMQEIKASEEKVPKEILYLPGYEKVWNPAKRPGYAGTAVFYKSGIKPENIDLGIGKKKFDDEGRVMTLEFKRFYFVNSYFPNSQHGLTRLKFKLEFDKEIQDYLDKLRDRKPVVVCGDFNVAHKPIDLANPKQNEKNAGFTPEERAWMDKFLADGWIDSFRLFTKEGGHYTWWTYRFNARARNIGWRVDYFIVSKNLVPKVKRSWILSDVYGSDHAPIGLELGIQNI